MSPKRNVLRLNECPLSTTCRKVRSVVFYVRESGACRGQDLLGYFLGKKRFSTQSNGTQKEKLTGYMPRVLETRASICSQTLIPKTASRKRNTNSIRVVVSTCASSVTNDYRAENCIRTFRRCSKVICRICERSLASSRSDS